MLSSGCESLPLFKQEDGRDFETAGLSRGVKKSSRFHVEGLQWATRTILAGKLPRRLEINVKLHTNFVNVRNLLRVTGFGLLFQTCFDTLQILKTTTQKTTTTKEDKNNNGKLFVHFNFEVSNTLLFASILRDHVYLNQKDLI